MKLPDITPAQVVAVVTWLVTQVVARGWVDNNTGAIVLQLAGTVIPSVWLLSDAIIRHGRSRALANVNPTTNTTVGK